MALKLLRHFRRSSFHPPSSQHPSPPAPPDLSTPSSVPAPVSAADTPLKPIYIYPGLLRIVRDKAIALDNQCPAVLYKCRDCRKHRDRPSTHPTHPTHPDPTAPLPSADHCPHSHTCPICLDEFHGKDLVRKMPCSANHVFHSKCILDWFVSHFRCPLCNQPINHIMPLAPDNPNNDTTTNNNNDDDDDDNNNNNNLLHPPTSRIPASVLVPPTSRRMASDLLAEVRRGRSLRLSHRSRMSPRQASDLAHTSHNVPVSNPPQPVPRPRGPRRYGRGLSDLQAVFRRDSRQPSADPVRLHSRPARQPARSLPARPLSTPPTVASHPPSSRHAASLRHGHAVYERDRADPPSHHLSPVDATSPNRADKSRDSNGDKTRRKSKGPRTYSYIVHDNVRMELNPVIPV